VVSWRKNAKRKSTFNSTEIGLYKYLNFSAHVRNVLSVFS
jgi:hypothetical protein